MTDETNTPPEVQPGDETGDDLTQQSLTMPGEKDRTAPEPPSATDAGVPHVGDAAPDDVDEDAQSSVVTETDGQTPEYEVNPPATMAEQEAPVLEGEAYQRGYFGETAADRAKAEQDAALKVQTNTEAVAAVSNKDEE